MAKWSGRKDKADEYHEKFAERMIAALEKGTAPWQKPWEPGERILPHNFSTGRNYRGGNAMYLATVALERGYSDPRWGGFKQIDEAGGHVRKGEKGTPIMYVEFTRRRTVRDDQGQPVRDKDGQPQIETERRDRPLMKMQYVWNVEQTEGLKLKSLERPAPAWEGHERAEAVMRNSGVRIDNVAGDRAFYSQREDRVVLPERGQFASQESYTHTALHELGHATGHKDRLNRPTLTKHDGFGSEMYAREELRAEIAAMMTGERLGVGHEPRHGTAYVASWVKALQNNPREIREASVDAQRASDWLVARERERAVEKDAEKEQASAGGDRRAPAREVAPELAAAREAEGPPMSRELADTLRAVGARGYRAGYLAGETARPREPWSSAREAVGEFTGERTAAGVELRFVLERAHSQGYSQGYNDRMQGKHERAQAPANETSAEIGDRGPGLWAELRKTQREHGGGSYVQGYDDGAGGKAPRRSAQDLPGATPGLDAAWDLAHDVRDRGYSHGHREGVSGAMKRDVAVTRSEQAVTYGAEARFGQHNADRAAELERREATERERQGVPEAADKSRAEHDEALRDTGRQAINPAPVGGRRPEERPVEHTR